MPPNEIPASIKTIGIEDVDQGVFDWFSKSVDAKVDTPQGEKRSLAIKFAAGERFVAAADKDGIRDRDGRLILPVLQITRTGMDFSTNKTALGINVPRIQFARLVSEATSELEELDSSRPVSQRRLRDGAVYEIWTVPYPSPVLITYNVMIQTQFQTHMNTIVEKIANALEFFTIPTFVIPIGQDIKHQPNVVGDGSTEVEASQDSLYEDRKLRDDYYVVGYIEGEFKDQGNSKEFTDKERIIQLQFNFTVPTALLLDPSEDRPAPQRQRTAFGVTFDGIERVIPVRNINELDKIFGKK